jgi:hypothetical protein
MAVGKWLGVVKNAALEHSSWITPCRLEELGGEWRWGDRKSGGNAQARCSTLLSLQPCAVAVEQSCGDAGA